MTLTPSQMLAKAIKITATDFIDTMDKGGHPYVLHCFAVMDALQEWDNEVKSAAMLHDTVEDTGWTIDMLRAEGFSERVLWMVDACTKRPHEDYMTYIGRVSCHPETRAIKLADLRHNMRPDRLLDLTDKTMERMKKYHTAYQFLTNNKKYEITDIFILQEGTSVKVTDNMTGEVYYGTFKYFHPERSSMARIILTKGDIFNFYSKTHTIEKEIV